MSDYQNIYDFEVTPEDEHLVKNLPKVPAICQFMIIFKNVLKLNTNLSELTNIYTQPKSSLPKTISPQDLEQSILRPQFDPLVGELVSRLLQKNKWKLKEGAQEKAGDPDKEQAIQSYEQWNENLAKKFNVMFKVYKKFQ